MQLGHVARSGYWFITSLMGDRAYDSYVAHLAAQHPGQTPVDERAFWVERYREKSESPGAMCC